MPTTQSLPDEPEDVPQPRNLPLPPDPRVFLDIPINDLVVDPKVQREQEGEKVQRIANELDWRLFECPTVVETGDGRFRVIEGGHRILALRRRGYRGPVHCAVLPETDERAEVEVGLKIATNRTPHSALAKWEARYRQGQPYEVAAEDVLRAHGLRLGRSQSAHTIAAVNEVSAMIRRRRLTPELGAQLLDRVLVVLTKAYPELDPQGSVSRFDGRLLHAVSEVVARNGGRVDVQRLVAQLQRRQAARWVSQALGLAETRPWDLIGSRLVEQYNKGLRNDERRLSW